MHRSFFVCMIPVAFYDSSAVAVLFLWRCKALCEDNNYCCKLLRNQTTIQELLMRILLSALLLLAVIANSRAAAVAESGQPASVSGAEHNLATTASVSSSAEPVAPAQLKIAGPEAETLQTSTATASDQAFDNKQSVSFKSLAQMNELIELGVPALALNLLEDEQKKRKTYSPDWYSFEYKRFMLITALEQWYQLIKRADWLFATTTKGKNITAKIRLWFETQQVMARLQLQQSEQALQQLQKLLWQTEPELRNPSLSSVWRRLVIRSYLQMNKDDDARKALLKYELDYKSENTDTDWLLLQSRVLLRTGRPLQALEILQQVPGDEAKALGLIARLQANPEQAEQINARMRQLLDGQLISRSARWAYSYVAYTAAKLLADIPSQIQNMEVMLSLKIDYPVLDESYRVNADDLWALYSQQGFIVANDKGLLLGNNEQWLQQSTLLMKTDAENALALNAALVLQPDGFAARQQHKLIVENLEQRKNGLELINQLYLHSSKVQNVNVLPDEVRYRLVDYALSEGNYFEAATLMNSLQEPPGGKSLFDWRMRKARVLILQGAYKQSENIIRRTFAEKKSITHKELDRFIQVVFDFQTVHQHDSALALFELISFDGLDEKLKREIYFWKAESYFSLKNYDRAALNYLASARAVTDADNDLWAQSARFKAGNALVQAAIYDDAERVFKNLLAITLSDSRKALIKQNLQKIRLLKSTVKNNGSQ